MSHPSCNCGRTGSEPHRSTLLGECPRGRARRSWRALQEAAKQWRRQRRGNFAWISVQLLVPSLRSGWQGIDLTDTRPAVERSKNRGGKKGRGCLHALPMRMDPDRPETQARTRRVQGTFRIDASVIRDHSA